MVKVLRIRMELCGEDGTVEHVHEAAVSVIDAEGIVLVVAPAVRALFDQIALNYSPFELGEAFAAGLTASPFCEEESGK